MIVRLDLVNIWLMFACFDKDSSNFDPGMYRRVVCGRLLSSNNCLLMVGIYECSEYGITIGSNFCTVRGW